MMAKSLGDGVLGPLGKKARMEAVVVRAAVSAEFLGLGDQLFPGLLPGQLRRKRLHHPLLGLLLLPPLLMVRVHVAR